MVSNLLRLLDLQAEVKTLLAKGLLDMGHARALLALEGGLQIEAANKVVKQGLTVRATEKLIKNLGSEKTTTVATTQDADTLRLQTELSEKTGAKVIINHQQNGKGKLIFNYTSLEELEGIISRIS
jgi:ParB family chromosome partitioning protein